MRFQPAPAAPQAAQPTAVAATAGAPTARVTQRDTAPFVTRLLPEPPEAPSAALDGLTTSVGIPDVSDGAGYRVRTGDIQLGKQRGYVGARWYLVASGRENYKSAGRAFAWTGSNCTA
jgi:hypothetical protein